jgi:hypothetical protein
MSAQTTIETVQREQVVAFIDGRGYQYCATCYHAGIPSLPCDRASVIDGDSCDYCDRDMAQSVEIVTGTSLVEYPACKIF